MPDTLRVGWDHNVDPAVPLVTTVEIESDGYASVSVKTKDESLILLWTEIERLREKIDKLESLLDDAFNGCSPEWISEQRAHIDGEAS